MRQGQGYWVQGRTSLTQTIATHNPIHHPHPQPFPSSSRDPSLLQVHPTLNPVASCLHRIRISSSLLMWTQNQAGTYTLGDAPPSASTAPRGSATQGCARVPAPASPEKHFSVNFKLLLGKRMFLIWSPRNHLEDNRLSKCGWAAGAATCRPSPSAFPSSPRVPQMQTPPHVVGKSSPGCVWDHPPQAAPEPSLHQHVASGKAVLEPSGMRTHPRKDLG